MPPVAPFQGLMSPSRQPGAVPRATLSQPFGLEAGGSAPRPEPDPPDKIARPRHPSDRLNGFLIDIRTAGGTMAPVPLRTDPESAMPLKRCLAAAFVLAAAALAVRSDDPPPLADGHWF